MTRYLRAAGLLVGGFPDGVVLLEDLRTLASWMVERKQIPAADRWVDWMAEQSAESIFESMF